MVLESNVKYNNLLDVKLFSIVFIFAKMVIFSQKLFGAHDFSNGAVTF